MTEASVLPSTAAKMVIWTTEPAAVGVPGAGSTA
jgi:hypothetical protein